MHSICRLPVRNRIMCSASGPPTLAISPRHRRRPSRNMPCRRRLPRDPELFRWFGGGLVGRGDRQRYVSDWRRVDDAGDRLDSIRSTGHRHPPDFADRSE